MHTGLADLQYNFCKSTVCPACAVDFQHRSRLAHHFSYSSKVCLRWAEQNVAPLAPDLVKELDDEIVLLRLKARKSGRSDPASTVPASLADAFSQP